LIIECLLSDCYWCRGKRSANQKRLRIPSLTSWRIMHWKIHINVLASRGVLYCCQKGVEKKWQFKLKGKKLGWVIYDSREWEAIFSPFRLLDAKRLDNLVMFLFLQQNYMIQLFVFCLNFVSSTSSTLNRYSSCNILKNLD
jgi:hypothetical protein